MGLAYLMFGLIVSLRVGLAGTYNHGDMLLQMVTESEQVTATRAKKDHMLCASRSQVIKCPLAQMSNGRKPGAY